MARFFVGQRVRLVKPAYLQNYGITGVIELFENWPAGTLCTDGKPLVGDADCEVRWDDNSISAQHTSELEPILPQHQPCESDFKETMDKLVEELETVQ